MAASKKDNVNAGRVEYLGDDREGKLAALNNAVAAIEKNYGKGSIMKLGDSGANIDIEAIPTGSISLDVLVVFQEDESSKFMDQNPVVRQQ